MSHRNYILTFHKLFLGSLLLTLAITPLTSCRVSYSFTGASISPEVKTVSIQYFQNLAPLVNPSLSNYFTEELKNKFVSQTNLNIINEYGDLQFSGQIVGYTFAPIAIQGNEVAAKNRLTITVKVKFENAKDDKFNYDKSFTQFEDFDSNVNFTQVEGELVRLIVEKLIDEIFNNAVANW